MEVVTISEEAIEMAPSTAEVETAAGLCSSCHSAKFLDAYLMKVCCPVCDIIQEGSSPKPEHYYCRVNTDASADDADTKHGGEREVRQSLRDRVVAIGLPPLEEVKALSIDEKGSVVDFVPGFLLEGGRGAEAVLERLLRDVKWSHHAETLGDGATEECQAESNIDAASTEGTLAEAPKTRNDVEKINENSCSRVVLQPRKIAYEASDSSLEYDFIGLDAKLLPTGMFTPVVDEIRCAVELWLTSHGIIDIDNKNDAGDPAGSGSGYFNSAHMNLYRGTEDHISWHSDEDVGLYGELPVIASVSFGFPRDFVLRRMHGVPYGEGWRPVQPRTCMNGDSSTLDTGTGRTTVAFTLGNGDLLVMRGSTQRHWEHCLRKGHSCFPAEAGSTGSREHEDEEVEDKHARVNITFRRVVGQVTVVTR